MKSAEGAAKAETTREQSEKEVEELDTKTWPDKQ